MPNVLENAGKSNEIEGTFLFLIVGLHTDGFVVWLLLTKSLHDDSGSASVALVRDELANWYRALSCRAVVLFASAA